MAVQLKKPAELSVIEELKWAEHNTQTNKIRKSKCLKNTRGVDNFRITVWRPKSLQIEHINTPFQRKMTPGHTVINRSILSAREHIQLLAIPKKLIYDPHILKPVRKSLRSYCSPRLAKLSVPKKDRIFCTWTQYHHQLASSKFDRLYELLTLEIPNRSKPGTRGCSEKIKSARNNKQQTKSRTSENIFEYTIHQFSICSSVRISDWICCQIGRKLNRSQKHIAYHLKMNLEKHCMISRNYNSMCEPIKLNAIIVSKILHQVMCYDSYMHENMFSDSKNNIQSDDQNKSFKPDGDSDGSSNCGVDVFHKDKIPSKKSNISNKAALTSNESTSEIQKPTELEDMDSTIKSNIKKQDINAEDNAQNKSCKSNVYDAEDQNLFPKEQEVLNHNEIQDTRSILRPETKEIIYNLVHVTSVVEKPITGIPSTPTICPSTSRICNLSDELNCLCKEIYQKLAIISSDLHNFDIMPHAPNTVCCASVKAWARFLGEMAEITKKWCYWITKTIKKMRKIARILKCNSTYFCGCKKKKVSYNSYRQWVKFFETLDCDIGRWRTYNSHVHEISEEIVSHYKNKSVECCELYREESYDITQLSVRHVCKQLMDALNASKHWREWLGEMIDACESLTKLITKDEATLIKLSMPDYEMRKHKCHIEPFQGSIYSISEINV